MYLIYLIIINEFGETKIIWENQNRVENKFTRFKFDSDEK